MELTRRQLVASTAAATFGGALAGCLGSAGGETDAATTAASTFFVFGAVTDRVAGDAATADLLVPTGQHGHGWEPGPSVREDVQKADLLVHGPRDFQPWADDIRGELDADDADVHSVDVTSNVDLLEAGASHDDGHDGDDHDGEEDSDDHDHGAHDPHFWMDPLRLRDAVGTVRAGLVDVDPDNADAYADNAAAYESELAALHETMQATVEAASTDVLLVAGHDSVQYLGDRYGVHVEALTGVAPDDQPTTRDVADAQAVIDEHDLEYVVADPLESQSAAETLVEETDATEVLPLTAMPGLTDEWADDGWGYVDVMREVNVPTLEAALDAR